MGCVVSKNGTSPCESTNELKRKIRELEKGMEELKNKREQEGQVYEKMLHGFMAKEMEWKREEKRWMEEMEEMKVKIEEKDEIMRRLEKEAETADKEWWRGLRNSFLVEHMREEQARREEALEKWKKLYLAIKTELDDLILRTYKGDKVWWGAEAETQENEIGTLQKELNAKALTIESLRKQVSALRKEGADKERELDIMKQSIRILNNAKPPYFPTTNFCICETKTHKLMTYMA